MIFVKIETSFNLLFMKITDEKLLQLCERYGRQALLWRRKFIGLLPEVNRRRLYEKKGCQSIFEFAAKLAGLSEEQVRVVLRLERRFEDKPTLKTLLVEGKASVNKLARVVSIATPENEEELADKVRLLPRGALETLVRDEHVFEKQKGLNKPLFDPKSLHVQTFKLSGEVVEELNQLSEQGQDVNAILLELLKERKEKIQQKKEELSAQMEPTLSRRIPMKTRRVLEEEFGQKCSISSCKKPAEEIHHTQRFSIAHTHDPRYLAPLCKEHHQLAHLADQSYREHRKVAVG